MKIGILSFHYVMNYGAVLQCYALCKTLRKLGHEAEIIDYRPWSVVLKHTGIGLRTQFLKKPRFKAFVRDNIPLSAETYWSANSLKKAPPAYDCYIVGSDQVWNPEVHHYFDTSYFFDFVPDTQGRLMSYAASFGNDYIGEVYKSDIARLVKRFAQISVREKSSQKMIAELTGRQADCVLDPTLLNVDYSEVIKEPPLIKPYIAVYCLEKSESFMRFVTKVRQITSLPTVCLGDDISGIDISAKHIGPAEWLGYLKNASYVCTNSFHGVAISTVFRKHLFVHPTSKRFVRITDLLESVRLSGQIIYNLDQLNTKSISRGAINYDEVNCKLNSLIASSMHYLNIGLCD